MISAPVDCGEGCCCNATLVVNFASAAAQVIQRPSISFAPPSDLDTPPSSPLIPVIAKHLDGAPDLVWNPASGTWY